jgi:hypothetical protein
MNVSAIPLDMLSAAVLSTLPDASLAEQGQLLADLIRKFDAEVTVAPAAQRKLAQPTVAATPFARRRRGPLSDTDLLIMARELRDFDVPELAAALEANPSTIATRVAVLGRRGALVRQGDERGPSLRWKVRSGRRPAPPPHVRPWRERRAG